MATTASLRIDRWLWFARFYKTRTLASSAVAAGHVRVNGERASPGQRVSPGDRIELKRNQLPYALDVTDIPARRGPASEAARCYVEDPAVSEQRDRLAAELKSDRALMPRTSGRPDKHTRRLLRERGRGQ